MYVLILYNFYCKTDLTVLAQIFAVKSAADRMWKKRKDNKNAHDVKLMCTNSIVTLFW